VINISEQDLMQNWHKPDKPLVSICCTTYNHEAFITTALDGFLIQKTDFPFEILIRDDCSTDNTAQIIREYVKKYPHIIKPIYEAENQFSKGVKPMPVLYRRALGEYIALCEGDDYWTCKDKLSRQVKFLQKNLKYSFCWTRFVTLDDVSGIETNDKNGKYFVKTAEEGIEFGLEHFCIWGWHIGMQTLVYRKEAYNNELSKNIYYKDTFMIADFLNKGVGYCLPSFCAVYRIHDGGIYSGTSDLDRAVQGANTYREIYSVFSNQEMLRKKYFSFSNALLVKTLLKGAIKSFLGEAKHRLVFQNIFKFSASFSCALTRELRFKISKLFS